MSRSVGVKEELLLVDPDSGRACALSPVVLRDVPEAGYALTSELMCQQIEANTRSFRSQVWSRWPSAGSTELFGSAETYRATTRAMIETRTLLDLGMVYFEARLSSKHPTVEVRIADVCLIADDAVLLAALVRGLVDTAARLWRAGVQPAPLRTELLRLAGWRTGRSGLDGDLLDPAGRPAPAEKVIGKLMDHVGLALDERGEREMLKELVTAVLKRGNGATMQRQIHRSSGQLTEVVAHAVRHTIS